DRIQCRRSVGDPCTGFGQRAQEAPYTFINESATIGRLADTDVVGINCNDRCLDETRVSGPRWHGRNTLDGLRLEKDAVPALRLIHICPIAIPLVEISEGWVVLQKGRDGWRHFQHAAKN